MPNLKERDRRSDPDVTSGKPELNAAGDYYAAHEHSLKRYAPAAQ